MACLICFKVCFKVHFKVRFKVRTTYCLYPVLFGVMITICSIDQDQNQD